MAKGNDSITVAKRLSRFGLGSRKLKNLNVKEGATLHLDPADKKHADRIEHLKVKSAGDLKRWLGVPEGATGQSTAAPSGKGAFVSAQQASFLPFPAVPLDDPEMHAHLMTYLMSPALEKPTATEKKLITHLDKLIRDIGISISIFLAQDIHIEENATLSVDPKIQTLFANAVILEDNATLSMQSSVSQIDCTRLHFVKS
jgi:hypothetical protein